MILADVDIEHFQRLGMLEISPYMDHRLQPASYDLTLGPYVGIWERYSGEDVYRVEKFDEGPEGELEYWLDPGDFVIMSTVETVTLSDSIAGDVAGKSSIARKGVIVEAAGFVDPGFSGQLTLEVFNMRKVPVLLTAGMAIAQIKFYQTRSKARRPYGTRGHYQGQKGPTPSWF